MKTIAIGPWILPAVGFVRESVSMVLQVHGLIGNSITTSEVGSNRTREWKRAVSRGAKSIRGNSAWEPSREYAISIGFSFHPRSHGNRQLDVENFIKPAIDALAAGLFCDAEADPGLVARYDYDDSNFRHLFIHRLGDALEADTEGAAIYVSARDGRIS